MEPAQLAKPQLWRLHIKPKPHNGVDPRDFCFDTHSVAGVGWAVDDGGLPVDWDRYNRLYAAQYAGDRSGKAATHALHSVRVGDLIWSRDWHGVYYLGLVTSPWRYEIGKDYSDADIVNVVGCEWLKVGSVDLVPGAVANALGYGRVMQRVSGNVALAYSMYLIEKERKNESDAPWQPEQWPALPGGNDPFQLFSPDDCEDLVGLYLQDRGWVIIPSSCKRSTAGYEFILYHRDLGEKAAVQVKHRKAILDVQNFLGLEADRVYLFATSGKYTGTPSSNMVCLTWEEMHAYLMERAIHLAPRLRLWVEIARELTGR